MDANDPRLTAYALDELHDPAQQTEVKAAVAADPALAAEVEEIRRLASWLKQSVGAQRPPASPGIRSSVEAALGNGQAAKSDHAAGNGSAPVAGQTESDGNPNFDQSPSPAAAAWNNGRNRAMAAVAAVVACAAALTLFMAYQGEKDLPRSDVALSSRQVPLQDRLPYVETQLAMPQSDPEAAVVREPVSGRWSGPGGLAPGNPIGKGAVSGMGGMGGAFAGGGFGFEASGSGGLLQDEINAKQNMAIVPSLISDGTSTESERAGQPDANHWRRSEITPNASRLMIGEQEELPLQALQANVQVDGFRARVLIDLYYYNDRNRQYEGTFKIRLPADASLYFLAFGETVYKSPQPPALTNQVFFSVERTRDLGSDPEEIMLARSETWKEPKEARVVTKEKAAYSYRETVRRRVDPALAEWAGAGVFSARVFPLAPHTLHRIVIGYDVNLLEAGNELLYRLDLPQRVPQLVVDLHVNDYAGRPPRIRPIQPGEKPSLVNGKYHYRFENPSVQSIELRQRATQPLLLTGHDTSLGDFFATRLRVPEVAEAQDAAPAERAAKRAWFLVDTSLSAAPDRMNIYLDLLQAILHNNRDTIESFQVQFFNIESHTWQSKWVRNTPQNVAAAVEYAHGLALEGATDLEQALRYAGSAPPQAEGEGSPANDQPMDMFLLSDGAATWGTTDADTLIALAPPKATLFAYTTGMSGDDTLLLSRLAQATGGAHFTVTGEGAVAGTAKAHRSRPWRLQAIEVPGGSDLLVAGRPAAVYPGQTLLIAGRGKPADRPITFRLEREGKEATYRVDVQQLDSDLAPRVYGQIATDCLEAMQTAAEEVAVAYARHFRVPGQTCSLLMLESEQDYLRFDIKPEDDTIVIQVLEATEALKNAQQRHEELRRSAKAAFQARLDRLTNMPGMVATLSPALRLAIDGLPDESFRLVRRPLECKLRRWQDLPGTYQDEVLSSRPLDYSQVSAEAARRLKVASAADALKAVSSLVELDPGDLTLARDVAYSAMEWGLTDQAFALLERVAIARPYEPQTYQAMAQCLAGAGLVDLAIVYYELAVSSEWDEDFGDFGKIATLDYLQLLKQIERGEHQARLRSFARLRQSSLQERLKMSAADLVVIIAWNTDGTDVDLHVTEPSGETCFYSHNKTRQGGQLTDDVTEGFGPEMYVLPEAAPGKYRIDAHYFAQDTNRASTRTRVFATVYRNWGTEREEAHRTTVTLDTGKQRHSLMTIEVK